MNTIPETPAVKSISTRYGDMTYFAKDSGAIRLSLEKYGEWAENEISFIKKFLQDGDTVIDVGAYIGTHTLAFARHVGLGGSVIAIEAQKNDASTSDPEYRSQRACQCAHRKRNRRSASWGSRFIGDQSG